MKFSRALFKIKIIIIAMLLLGCGKKKVSVDPPSFYSVGGTISGLSGTIVLQNNSGDNLSVITNGIFTFGGLLTTGDSYNATVFSQPSGQTCVISNGTGTINNTSITNILVTCSNNLKIFVTDSSTQGNFGGSDDADTLCLSDANYPGTGDYNAMVVDNLRRACTSANCATGGATENIDWVFQANTSYFQSNGNTLIGTTNAGGIFNFSLGDLDASWSSTEQTQVWTGLNTNWTSSVNNCTNWTTASVDVDGIRGGPFAVDSTAIHLGPSGACNASVLLVCVEQP